MDAIVLVEVVGLVSDVVVLGVSGCGPGLLEKGPAVIRALDTAGRIVACRGLLLGVGGAEVARVAALLVLGLSSSSTSDVDTLMLSAVFSGDGVAL